MRNIADYSLLGDRRTAALVARNGSIDWWCVPRFDDDACFAALLGGEEHGRFLVGTREEATTTRRYRPGTMVLETEHRTASGVVRVTDCLARGHARPTLVRLVEGVEGIVEMRVDLIVRFDYGHIVPWVRRVGDAWCAVAGPSGLALQTPVRIHGSGNTSVGSFTVRAGEQVPFVLGWFPSNDRLPVDADAPAMIAQTTKDWERWSRRCAYTGVWHDEVQRSIVTLEALTFAPTGGIVAAPTSSLPESPGGTRNWDYRYCWVRDATLALESLLIGGYADEAMRWRQWLLRAVAGDPNSLQIMYGVAGERRLTELELDWLPGFDDSKPVRTGNAAHAQLQLDVYGEIADVLWQSCRAGTMPDEDAWSLLVLLLDALEQRWHEPDEGIWEVRGGRKHFTYSKVMCWVAFDRAIAMVQAHDYEGPIDRWRALRDDIHAEVCARAYDDDVGAFMQSYDSDELDASVLMIPLVGFLPADDPRVLSTIDVILRKLTNDGFVMRYDPTDESIDGIGEPEGVFLPCSFWMAEALALAGRADEGRALFEKVVAVANDVGLLSEEYDPKNDRLLGNFPQAFTHLALVAAAHTLDPDGALHADRRRDRDR